MILSMQIDIISVNVIHPEIWPQPLYFRFLEGTNILQYATICATHKDV